MKYSALFPLASAFIYCSAYANEAPNVSEQHKTIESSAYLTITTSKKVVTPEVKNQVEEVTAVEEEITPHKVTWSDFKVDAKASQPEHVKDPLQAFNRKIYNFNETFDHYIAKPIAIQYKTKVPSDVRSAPSAFRNNIDEPWSAVNQLIQGRPMFALKSLGRFAINTLTSLGFVDTAKYLGLAPEEDNMRTTLAYYNVASGPYLVLPFFGPSTIRDAVGLGVDVASQIETSVFTVNDPAYWVDQGLYGIGTRANLLDYENLLQGDRYSAIRDVYLQRSAFLIAEKQGKDLSETLFIDDESDFETDEETLP